MTLPQLANSETVANAWIASLPGFTSAMVDQTLPSDNTTWAASGFVVPVVAGGVPDASSTLLIAKPVIMLNTYAVTPDTGQPAWGTARTLAEMIRRACSPLWQAAPVTPAYTTAKVIVQNAFVISEPRRSYGDPGDYAHYTLDLQLWWKVVG